jgi:hypothetical protein
MLLSFSGTHSTPRAVTGFQEIGARTTFQYCDVSSKQTSGPEQFPFAREALREHPARILREHARRSARLAQTVRRAHLIV